MIGEKRIAINGKNGDRLEVLYGIEPGSLLRNPVTGEWWALNQYGSPWIVAENHYRPIICHAHKWICFIIPKNGCSSVLKSALYYDGMLSTEEYKGSKFIWDGCFTERNESKKLEYLETMSIDTMYPDYKKFVVLCDERDRVMRWMNYLNKARYARYYSYELDDKSLADEMLWSMRTVAFSNRYSCDQHILPQSVFLYRYKEIYKGMDEVERVQLSELPEWYERNFGEPLVKNNISDPASKRFHFENLTASQQEIIEKWCETYH